MDTSNIRAAMYGPLEEEPKSLEEWPLSGKMAITPTLDLEPTGKFLLRLKKGNTIVVIPNAAYVQELEKRIQYLERTEQRLAATCRQLQTAHNSLVKTVQDMNKELKTKVSLRG